MAFRRYDGLLGSAPHTTYTPSYMEQKSNNNKTTTTVTFFTSIILLIGIMGIMFWILLPSGEKSDTNNGKTQTVYLGETVAFENGVEFSVTSAKFQTEIQGTYATYRADEGNKYVLLRIRVVNNSNEGYSAEGNEIWLNHNGARIAQINLIKNWADGFDDVSQSPTTTKTYNAFFQVGQQVQMSDLALVITNGSLFNNDAVKIWLTEK